MSRLGLSIIAAAFLLAALVTSPTRADASGIALTATVDGSTVTLTWAPDYDTVWVYRDGQEVDSTREGSWSETVEPGTYDYRVLGKNDNSRSWYWDAHSELVTASAAPSGVDRILSGDVDLDGLTVPAGETWAFDPGITTTVESTGNVVVLGTLQMRPSSDDVTHTLRFTDVDESAFVGGGTSVLASDVGLWVMDAGTLDAVGSERQGWARAWHHTWADDDEVVRAPTEHRDYFTFTPHTRADPVPQARPDVPSTELINLTRNVRIEGTPQGRSHVLIHNHHGRQTIRNVAIRHMGVPGALGRYGLHFHHGFDATRGSLVENVVVRDSGSQAFVPHLSHGITFKHTVAFDTAGPAYWWDSPEGGTECRQSEPQPHPDQCNESHDITYDHAMAARTGQFSDSRSGLRGFALMSGIGNVIRDSVAVGTGGQTNSSGYNWPSNVNHSENVWAFEDNIAHNNKINGIYVWQNDNNPHLVDRFLGYRNGNAGIEHGAYGNPYVYRDSRLLENDINLLQHLGQGRVNEVTGTVGGHHRMTIDGGRFGVYITNHNFGSQIEYLACDVSNVDEPVYLNQRKGPAAAHDFVHCTVDGSEMTPSDVRIARNDPGSTIRIQQTDGTAWQITGVGNVTPIAPFYTR